MKILHTADWHLGTFRSPVKDGVNLRTEDTKRFTTGTSWEHGRVFSMKHLSESLQPLNSMMMM